VGAEARGGISRKSERSQVNAGNMVVEDYTVYITLSQRETRMLDNCKLEVNMKILDPVCMKCGAEE